MYFYSVKILQKIVLALVRVLHSSQYDAVFYTCDTKTVLRAHQCFSCCRTVTAQHEGLFCFSLCTLSK